MLLKKDESGRKSRKVDELAGFELLILTGIISLILDGNYIAGYNHKHAMDEMEKYRFTDVETLLGDFMADIAKARGY